MYLQDMFTCAWMALSLLACLLACVGMCCLHVMSVSVNRLSGFEVEDFDSEVRLAPQPRACGSEGGV